MGVASMTEQILTPQIDLVRELNDTEPYACRRLRITITNRGVQVIKRFKLVLRLTNIGRAGPGAYYVTDLLETGDDKTFSYSYWSGEGDNLDMEMIYESKEVLFPKESINIGQYEINWVFFDNVEWSNDQWVLNAKKENWALEWMLQVGSRPPKKGAVMIHELASL